MASVIIVDQNDQVIDSKERNIVDHSKDICRISVLWITNSKNQILLAQRKLTKKYNPGKWGPAVGGTNEEGETYESNIYKEASEEIGLKGYDFQKGLKFFVAQPNKKFCQTFYLNINWQLEQFNIQKEEVEQVRWFDQEELLEELKNDPDSYTEVVHLIMRSTKSK
ncbi:MAG: NUDIX domain-containing protein [Patescibacteria group bacterium]|nr:NUDIX domain-containing protein [Patescibacteria group bacterium]